MTTRTFTAADQDRFASLSGDFNPIHTDDVAARRLLFGSPVVHGVHLLLWAIDSLVQRSERPVDLRSLRVAFRRPVRVDDPATLTLAEGGAFRVTSAGGGLITGTVELGRGTNRGDDEPGVGAVSPAQDSPLDPSDDELRTGEGDLEIGFDTRLAADLFPRLTAALPPEQVGVLLATTRLVGMRLPGLHSLFSELELALNSEAPGQKLTFRAKEFDERFSLLYVDIRGAGMSGTIKAFRRPAPTRQAEFEGLTGQVSENEFAERRALIIGGSRGLGELAAKLLCAGGAEATITYNLGHDDAQRVVSEILSGGGRCSSARLDVLAGPSELAATLPLDPLPTEIYYFATPFIFSGVSRKFSQDLFLNFCAFYVTAFESVVTIAAGSGVGRFFYPSTVAVDSPEANLGEYAAAKSAGESLCAYMERVRGGIAIHRPRLPRLATDQTATLTPWDTVDAVTVLLREIRAFGDVSRTTPTA